MCIRDRTNGASPLHRHNYFEMGFVFQGECISISDGEEAHLHEGDLFIVSLQALHQMKTFSLDDYVFNIMINTSLFDQQFFQMIAGNDLFTQFFMNSILNIRSDSCMIFRSGGQTDFIYYLYKLLCEYLFSTDCDQTYIPVSYTHLTLTAYLLLQKRLLLIWKESFHCTISFDKPSILPIVEKSLPKKRERKAEGIGI